MTIAELKALKLQQDLDVCEECGDQLDEKGNCPSCDEADEEEIEENPLGDEVPEEE